MSQTLKFLVGREFDGQVNSNKSCYFVKDGVMIILNCGKGVVDAMRRGHTLDGVKDVYVVITNSSKEHLYDLKKFFFVLKNRKIMPKLIDSISLNKKLLKRMKINENDDYLTLEPLKNNIKWINFLAVPHKNKNFSCPVELYLNDQKIFYGGDANSIPFAIENYDEYYFDFGDKTNEYSLDIDKIKSIVRKNKIKKSKLWLVHLQNLEALRIAQTLGMQVAQEETQKFTRPIPKRPTKIAKQSKSNEK